MRYVKVIVRRDESNSIPAHVGAWEVPVMEAVHGEEKLTVGETVDFETRPWPEDAKSEFSRLAALYGRTGSGDAAVSYVERVYGSGSTGVKALAAAIADARKAAEPKAKRGRPSKAAEDLVGAASA